MTRTGTSPAAGRTVSASHGALPLPFLRRALAGLTLAAALAYGSAALAEDYDMVVANGRVIDPDSGLDAVRDLGIRDGRIAAVSKKRLRGRDRIDATGKVVAPGFIDLHSHAQNPVAALFQARDGVTTALELELGVFPVAPWYAAREGASPINYGTTVSQTYARAGAVLGADLFDKADDPIAAGLVAPQDAGRAMEVRLSEAQLADADRLMTRGLDEGALGIGMGIQYIGGSSREEVLRGFRLAAWQGVTVFAHQRSAGQVEPDSLAGLQELIADAASTGAGVHVAHVNSTGLGQAGLLLDMIDGARAHGVDVTTEAYPFNGAMAVAGSPLLRPGWQDRYGIGYGDLLDISTGRRMTKESFEAARRDRPETRLVVFVMSDDTLDRSISHPGVMIASDAVDLENGEGHPRTAGTFSRVLGHYVRERGLISLPDAIARMTILPARRLEASVPAMARKGRLSVGADADITVFDPATVAERATYAEPAQASRGIFAVLVEGTPVVRDGVPIEGAMPGRPVRRPLAAAR